MERNLLLKEIEALDINDHEFEDPDAAAEDPNLLIREAAIIPFSEADRKCLYAPLLSAADNKKITAKNKASLPKYGVNKQNILRAIASYVDLDVLKQAMGELSSDTPANDDSLLTEAVHQFQAKIFTSPKEWDGVIGPSVISGLGFVFHNSKVFSASKANTSIKSVFGSGTVSKAIEAHKSALNISGLAQITGPRWFHYIINPGILGWNGSKSRGFHLFLILEFRKAENELLQRLAGRLKQKFDAQIKGRIKGYSDFPQAAVGQVPRFLGKLLAIKQKHQDTRDVSKYTPRSFHLSGLAIDINYTTNPWVKGKDVLKLFKSLGPDLVRTNKATAQQYFAELAAAIQDSGDIYDILSNLNRLTKQYYSAKYSNAPQTTVHWGGSTRSFEECQGGFLDHSRDLVTTLRDVAGLAWGALDLGTGDMGNGDMMHFDMRTSLIGQAYFNAIGNGGSIAYLKSIHPAFRSGRTTPTLPQRQPVVPKSASSAQQKVDPDGFNVSKAVNSNRIQSQQLGWDKYIPDIEEFVLKLTLSPMEEDFARAVAKWQEAEGLSVDGVIGKNTWARMQSRISGKSSAVPSVSAPTTSGLGKLIVAYPDPSKPFTYDFTYQDAEWACKMMIGEAGGKINTENEAVLWAMINNFGLVRQHKYEATFAEFIRKYSTTLQEYVKNPIAICRVLNKEKRGEKVRHYGRFNYKGSKPIKVDCLGSINPEDLIPKLQLEKYVTLQNMRWNEIDSKLREMVVKILSGKLPNKYIGLATDVQETVTTFYEKYKRKTADGITTQEWEDYNRSLKKQQKQSWIGNVDGLKQKGVGSFFIYDKYKSLPLSTVTIQ